MVVNIKRIHLLQAIPSFVGFEQSVICHGGGETQKEKYFFGGALVVHILVKVYMAVDSWVNKYVIG